MRAKGKRVFMDVFEPTELKAQVEREKYKYHVISLICVI